MTRTRHTPRRAPRLARLLIAPLAVLTATLLWEFGPPATAFPQASGRDSEAARFAKCGGGARVSCVIDGDTFWYRGAKIRIADINAPETSKPRCPAEAQLGARATARLTALLNAGPFTLESGDRQTDRYGRKLFVVTRAGESLGGTLEAEGLAEPWRGYRRDWC